MFFLNQIKFKSMTTINIIHQVEKNKKHNKAQKNDNNIICIMKGKCDFLKFWNFK